MSNAEIQVPPDVRPRLEQYGGGRILAEFVPSVLRGRAGTLVGDESRVADLLPSAAHQRAPAGFSAGL
jgi:hypothetical protein